MFWCSCVVKISLLTEVTIHNMQEVCASVGKYEILWQWAVCVCGHKALCGLISFFYSQNIVSHHRWVAHFLVFTTSLTLVFTVTAFVVISCLNPKKISFPVIYSMWRHRDSELTKIKVIHTTLVEELCGDVFKLFLKKEYTKCRMYSFNSSATSLHKYALTQQSSVTKSHLKKEDAHLHPLFLLYPLHTHTHLRWYVC